MIIEVKLSFDSKPKKETITFTDMTDSDNPKTSTIQAPNDSWNSKIFVEVADNTTAGALADKLIKYYVDNEKAIAKTIKIKKLARVKIIKL